MNNLKIQPIPQQTLDELEQSWIDHLDIAKTMGVPKTYIAQTPLEISSMLSADAVSMYPNVMSFMNSVKPLQGMGYYINSEFPYDIKFIHADELVSKSTINTTTSMRANAELTRTLVDYERHERRMEAEKERLENLYYYYKEREDNISASKYFQELKTIEEEHPEWTI